MSRPYNDKQYQTNRRILLEPQPLCHWCRRRKATTADHLIELDRGGTHDLENLVPACHKCNSSRGATYGNTKPGNKRPPLQRPVLTCASCGLSFVPNCKSTEIAAAKYCSNQCRLDGQRKKETMTTVYRVRCTVCAEYFSVSSPTNRPPKKLTCSPKCSEVRNARRSADNYHKNKGTTPSSSHPPLLEPLWQVTAGGEAMPTEQVAPSVFRAPEAPTPPESSPISCGKRSETLKVAKATPKPGGSLRIPPRLETAKVGEESYGPLVVAWAKRALGLELMDWQIHALTGQLAHGPDGRLAHRRSCVSVARQNGKSTALQALVGWWLVEAPALRGGPQTVITTAHQLDLATALFQTLAPVLEAQYGAKPKWSYGRNELTMPDGSIWLVRAATPAAGHGRSPDLVVIDELWDVDGDVVEQGLIPAQRARKSPLCSMWSTAGTEASRYMQRVREEGIALIDNGDTGSLYYAEWSPAPGADLDDPDTWLAANPAIGTTLELDTLIAESKTPNRAAFYRASLNIWVASDRAWLDPAVWDRAAEPGPINEDPVVLAIDSSKDGERYVGIIARPIPGGDPGVPRVRLEVAINARTEAEMWRKVVDVIPTGPCQLAVTPGLDGRVPPDLVRRRVVVGEQEIRKWTNLVSGLIADRRVCHDRSELLTEHMTRAVAVTSGSGITLSSYKSPGPIELARCAIWAAALATKPVRTGRPMVITTAAR